MLQSKFIIMMLIIISNLLSSSCASKSFNISKDIYVALSGDDSGNGNVDNPVKTLTKALTLASTFKRQSVNILLREGSYIIDKTVQFTKRDDRLSEFPLVISSYKTEKVSLIGAKPLPYWNKVIDSEILKRLPKASRKQVYVTNLRQYGISNFGLAKSGGVELYFNDNKMQLARFPNKGLLTIGNLVEPNTQIIRNYKGSKVGKFHYNDNAIKRWVNESDVWLHGYWFWDWKDQSQNVEHIDIVNKTITLKEPYHSYGYRKGQEYFAYNILAELDVENEWYLDRASGKLYFYPKNIIKKNNPPILAVVDNLIELNNASNITIKNITLAYTKNNGVSISGGKNNLLDGVVVKHIGNQAVTIRNSLNSKIISSEVYSIGGGAILIEGGNRNTLTSANMCAINNRIHDYATVKTTYHPGISLRGVGNCAKNNEIYNAPHIAIYFSGNNHLIAYNNIHHVVNKSNDAGAIYAGRDWTSRGTVIKHNYIHDINGYNGKGAKGIYLDDEFSGVTITGNIFDNVYHSIFIGGGRDNIVDNNIFINSVKPIHIDTRGVTWAKKIGIKQLTRRLNDVPHDSPIWKNQYPKLSNVLIDNPRLPVGNEVKNNVFYDDKWNFVFGKAKPYTLFESNHHLFDSLPTKDYQVKTPLDGFQDIPFNKIGVKN
jgi:parallel beta-helix repeat protein